MEIVQVMRAVGDENRLRILNLLRNGLLNVGEIEQILGMSQSNVSRHLNRLKSSHIVIDEKKAQRVYYRINQAILVKHPLLEELFQKELDKIEQCLQDLEKLREYRRNNPGGFANTVPT